MDRRMLLGVKERAERAAVATRGALARVPRSRKASAEARPELGGR
jgi:hypothetical protein